MGENGTTIISEIQWFRKEHDLIILIIFRFNTSISILRKHGKICTAAVTKPTEIFYLKWK